MRSSEWWRPSPAWLGGLLLVAGCDPSFAGSWTGDVVESGQLSLTGSVLPDGTPRTQVERITHSNTTPGATATIREDGDDYVVSIPGCEFRAQGTSRDDELQVKDTETCTVEAQGHSFDIALFGTVRVGGDERLFIELSGSPTGSGQNGGVSWSFTGDK